MRYPKAVWPLLAVIGFPWLASAAERTVVPTGGWNRKAWSTADGLYTNFCTTVEIGPSGRVFVTHGDDESMSVLDGFEAEWIPGPGYDFKIPIRVLESDSGQLWANWVKKNQDGQAWPDALDGIQLYSGGEWKQFELTELKPGWESFDWLKWRLDRVPMFAPAGPNRAYVVNSEKLVEFDAGKADWIEIKPASDTGLGAFLSIHRALDGGYWITGRNGLAKMETGGDGNPEAVRWREYPFGGDLSVFGMAVMYESRTGPLHGVALDSDTEEKTLLRLEDGRWERVSLAAGLPGNATADAVWPGGDGITWCYSSDKGKLISIHNGRAPARDFSGFLNLATEPDGSFWLAKPWGLERFAPNLWRVDGRFEPIARLDTRQGLYLDPQNRFWLMDAAGIHRLREGRIERTYVYPGNLPLYSWGASMAMLPDGRLAAAGFKEYLLIMDPDTGEFRPVRHPKPSTPELPVWIRKVKPTPRGGVLVEVCEGYQSGFSVHRFDGHAFQPLFERLPDAGTNVLGDFIERRNGEAWMAATGYLVRFRDGEYRPVAADRIPDKEQITTLFEDDNGVLWLGASNAVYRLDGDELVPALENSGMVRSISQSRDGSLWVGADIGIHCLRDGSWISYTEEEGLPEASIAQVAEDDAGGVWANTSIGVLRYAPEADAHPPETYISGGENLSVISSRGEARFVFSGRDRWNFSRPGDLYFSHRIDGGPWSPFSGANVVSLSGLGYGGHTFEARAMDLNWNIDPVPALWEFAVERPWYSEPAFMISTGVLLTVILILALMHINHHVNLGVLVERRTAELSSANAQLVEHRDQLRSLTNDLILAEDRERKKLAANLHDRIGQALALCQIQIDAVLDSGESAGVRKPLEKISEEIEQTIEDTRTLSFDISPPALYKLGLEYALEELVKRIGEQYGLRARLEYRCGNEGLSDDLKSFLYRSVRELLFNVLKHAGADFAEVKIEQRDGRAWVEVSDNGAGIKDTPAKSGGFGLMSIDERIKFLGGEFRIDSPNGGGARVQFSVPLDPV